MARFCVIIPAAGKAERFGGGEKKSFAKLDGRPVFLRTIEHFINRQDVCQKILAVAPEDIATVKSTYGANLGFMGIKLVEGGAQRGDTVAAALRAVSEEADYVAIHDAARPCISPDRIDAVFEEAVKSGAAILAVPIVGTLKRVAGSNAIEETVSRDGLYEAQTPQVFRKDILMKAYERLDATARAAATDDAQVVELSGHAVTVVPGDSTNIKITTKSDLTLAGAILKARPARTVPRMGAFEEAQW
ncbi:MAG: 2-C-methyl-D-erythritol 4-phosphate cytidylyltransferase [Planctomycetota bacterium]